MDKGAVIQLIFGRWRSQIAHAGVKLGVFEACGEQPKGAAGIAKELGLDPALSYRLLRALGCLGLLTEDAARRFSLAPGGEFLRADHPETLRGMILLEEGPEHYAIWKHLPDMIRDGNQNGFVREYGRTAFEFTGRGTPYGEVFDEAMSSFSVNETALVLEALSNRDFSRTAHLCDVGGGHGHLLSSFLRAHPHMKGTVVERTEVIDDESTLWAKKMNVADRCRYLAGDMFADVPPADAYLMKHILHDWNDEECIQILSNLRRAVSADGQVLIAEYIVSDPQTPDFAKLFDIHMMCWGTGRERTKEEYAALMPAAGWRHVDTCFPAAGGLGVVVGVAA